MAATLLASALYTTPASAAEIVGRASVIDGDRIEIHGQPIRILDIDAPETRQTCTRPDGTEWPCGQQAADALANWIGQRTVTCASDSKDSHGQSLARCVVGGKDLADWMALNGWAVPDRDCKCEVVRDAAGRAKAAKLGIWSGGFVMPWEFRQSE